MRVVYLVMHYPSTTQTFIEREMFALAGQGVRIEVRPIWDFRPPVMHGTPPAPLPPGITVVRPGRPWRVLASMSIGTARELIRRPTLLFRGLWLLLGNLPRHGEGWFMTIWGTLTALALAAAFRRKETPDVFHGTWATAPATAAAVLSELCGRPFSFGAHAYDIHRHGGDPFLAPKLRAARFVHTTTQANVDYLNARFPGRHAKIVLARRGLSRETIRHAGEIASQRLSKTPGEEFHLLSVGRLVEKKGHIHQLDACAELARRGRRFRLRIIGGGPLQPELEARIAAAGLGASIVLDGERPPAGVWEAYGWADVFWHTGIVDSQGDRDGLPNVIPEAMACGLPVISSTAGGAGEAVLEGVTGLIVADPSNRAALADAVERLAGDEALRAKLGAGGRAWVEENFLAEVNTRRLAEAFAAAGN